MTPHVQVRYSMLIEPATYLQTLVDDFALAGGVSWYAISSP
jgi:hypothetical protein